MASELRIGQLASAAGVSPDTVRYYERLKLIPRPVRTTGGYRVYSDHDVEQLQFIKRAQSLGLSLDEVKGLLPGRDSGLSECRRVRDLLSIKVAELDAKLAEMHAFRKLLGSYLNECEEALAGNRGDCCPVLFEITQVRQTGKKRAARKRRG